MDVQRPPAKTAPRTTQRRWTRTLQAPGASDHQSGHETGRQAYGPAVQILGRAPDSLERHRPFQTGLSLLSHWPVTLERKPGAGIAGLQGSEQTPHNSVGRSSLHPHLPDAAQSCRHPDTQPQGPDSGLSHVRCSTLGSCVCSCVPPCDEPVPPGEAVQVRAVPGSNHADGHVAG